MDSLPEDIEEIDVSGKGLTYLDVTRFKNLKKLVCVNNQLTSLHLNENLQELHCAFNQLTSLHLNENLQELHCSFNQLTSLHLNEKLKHLYCSSNRLTSLQTVNLESLDCYNNRLTSLHLNETIHTIYCSGNRLTSLHLKNVKYIFCSSNRLTSLPVLNANLHINYSNNPIYEIINSVDIDIINRKMQVLNDFRYLYYCLKFKKRFRDLLWVKIREPKIRSKYSHKYLVEHLRDTDLDEFLQNW